MSIVNIIKGVFIGIALVIPGLSGSIFAVVVGLYDKILLAVNDVSKRPKESIRFLAPIVLGVVFGILISTKAVLWVCQVYTVQSYSFFIGLVLGSIPLVMRKMFQISFKPLYITAAVGSCLALVLVSGMNVGGDEAGKYIAITQIQGIGDVGTMIFAGAFSCSLMAIPGVSGSIMLMVTNQYGSVYHAVSNCGDLLLQLLRGDMNGAIGALGSVLVLIPFLIGAAVGFVFIAKLLGFLLRKYEALMFYGVGGLIVATVIVLIQGGILPHLDYSGGVSVNLMTLVYVIVFAVIGVLCTLLFDKE